MTRATLLWLAVRGGASDRSRIVATALVAYVASILILLAIAVICIGPGDGPYASDLLQQPRLRRGLMVAMALLAMPLVALLVQCARIGAPARDRRLAIYRLAGATPRDVLRIVSAETGLAAALGSISATLSFPWLLPALGGATTFRGRYTREIAVAPDTVEFREMVGQVHLLPTDVSIPLWAHLLVAIGLPAVVSAVALVALRRVTNSPFGVVRRLERQTSRWWPAGLFVGGATGLGATSLVSAVIGDGPALAVVALLLVVATAGGLIWGTAAIAQGLGRFFAMRTRQPALLLAARRLEMSPHTASRVNAVILVVLMIGGGAQAMRMTLMAYTTEEDRFYAETFQLVDGLLIVGLSMALLGLVITTTETIVTSRRTLAALAAVGVPRRVLRRSLLVEAMLPLVPTAIIAVAAGAFAVRGIFGTERGISEGTVANERIVHVAIEIPWGQLTALTSFALLGAALMSWLALRFVDDGCDPSELRNDR